MGRAFFLSFPPCLSSPPSYSTPPQQSIYFSLLLIQSKAEQVQFLRTKQKKRISWPADFLRICCTCAGITFPHNSRLPTRLLRILGLGSGNRPRVSVLIYFLRKTSSTYYDTTTRPDEITPLNYPPWTLCGWLVTHAAMSRTISLRATFYHNRTEEEWDTDPTIDCAGWLAIALMTPKKRDRRPVINQATQ